MEESAYLSLWQRCYALPPRSTIPDWHTQLQRAQEKRETAVTPRKSQKMPWRLALTAVLAAMIISLALLIARKRFSSAHIEQDSFPAEDLAATIPG
jgi:hypothetical protein